MKSLIEFVLLRSKKCRNFTRLLSLGQFDSGIRLRLKKETITITSATNPPDENTSTPVDNSPSSNENTPWAKFSAQYDSLGNLLERELGSRKITLEYASRNRVTRSIDTGGWGGGTGPRSHKP